MGNICNTCCGDNQRQRDSYGTPIRAKQISFSSDTEVYTKVMGPSTTMYGQDEIINVHAHPARIMRPVWLDDE